MLADNIKIYLEETGQSSIDWIDLVYNTEHSNELLVSMELSYFTVIQIKLCNTKTGVSESCIILK
jgi:hypothetical protein